MPERTLEEISKEIKSSTVSPGIQDDGTIIKLEIEDAGICEVKIYDITTPSGKHGTLILTGPEGLHSVG